MSYSLWPHGLQDARLPCPSPSPGICSNSCLLSQWCHPTISSCVVPFSSRLQSFPASASFHESVLPIRWPKYWNIETYIIFIKNIFFLTIYLVNIIECPLPWLICLIFGVDIWGFLVFVFFCFFFFFRFNRVDNPALRKHTISVLLFLRCTQAMREQWTGTILYYLLSFKKYGLRQ